MSVIIEKQLSETVLGAVFSVHNSLGPGLLESAYEGALVIEFKHLQIEISRQHVYPVYYRGEMAGAYIADMVVDGKIILELKSVVSFTASMEAQLLNYLKLSGIRIGYLINFHGERVSWRRFVV